MQLPRYFHELNVTPIRDTLIILDIDGTLLADADTEVDEQTARVVDQLNEQGNMIYLCSNGLSHQTNRNRALADRLRVTFYETDRKKPFKQSVQPLLSGTNKPAIVIGDKFLTDGLLAINLGIPGIRVRSRRSAKDRFYVKCSYLLDDAASAVFAPLVRGPWYSAEVAGLAAPAITILTYPPTSLRTLPEVVSAWLRSRVKHLLFNITRASRFLSYGGPASVSANLERGLDQIGVAYRFNPWEFDATARVGVVAGTETLRWALEQKKKGFVKTIVAGPNIVTIPSDEEHLIQNPEIDQIVVPSQWNKNWWVSFDQALERRITPWAAGVLDIGPGRDPKGVCIVYSKQADEKLFNKIIEALWTYKLPIVVSKYGQFHQHEYFRLLKKARMMIYLSEFESQGLALHEAWMADIPTLIYDGGEVRFGEHRWKEPNISAPYFNPQCGLQFTSFEDFVPRLLEFQEKYDTFTPRRYSLANFTPAITARRYVDIIENNSAYEGGAR